MSKVQNILGLAVMAVAGILTLSTFAAIVVDAATQDAGTDALIDRGRYLVKTSGCNDCHTAGYAPAAGKVPQEDWLKGDSLGWRGPWGTTYAVNLRLYMHQITEAEWMQKSQALPSRPPMPWFMLRDMSDTDRRAIYHYVKFLGAAGDPAPAFVPPGAEPKTPYVQFPMPPK